MNIATCLQLVIARGSSTLHRARTVSSNHWVQPNPKHFAPHATFAPHAFFAHSAPGWNQTRTIDLSQSKIMHSPRPKPTKLIGVFLLKAIETKRKYFQNFTLYSLFLQRRSIVVIISFPADMENKSDICSRYF